MEELNNPIEEQEAPTMNDNELKDAIEEQLSKIRSQSMILGFRVACQTILDKIVAFERTPGSKSNNDHKRLIKEIKKFVETGLARKTNENVEIEVPGESESETVQD
jgi:hypothetical protein